MPEPLIASVEPKLSASDKARLDHFLTSVGELETRAKSTGGAIMPTGPKTYTRPTMSASYNERADIKTNIQRAYRWTFLVSGLTHPTFIKIVGELTEQGRRRLAAAAEALS